MKIIKYFIVTFILFAGVLSASWAATSDDYYQAGKKLYAGQDYNKAILYFGAAVKLDPNNVGALQGRGSCYYALGQYQNSLTDFQQVEALRPSTQMAAFIETVKAKAGVGGSAVPATAGAGNTAMAQGVAYYQQRQYSQAIDSFEQATQQDPQNYKPFYYLGLSRMMNGDRRGATLSLAIANELHPSAGLMAYVDKLKASLSGDDQSWVQANLNSYDHNNGASRNANSEDSKMIGVRFEPALAMPALGDFNADGQTRVAIGKATQVYDPSYQVTATVPSGYANITVEPVLKLSPSFEVGVPISILPVGSYTVVSTDNAGSTYNFSGAISGFSLGITGRYIYGDGPIKIFGAAGPLVAPLSFNASQSVAEGSSSQTDNASSSSLAIGGQIQAGADLHLGNGLLVSFFVGYQFLQASGFTGTDQSSSSYYGTSSATGEWYYLKSQYGNTIYFVPNDEISSLPSGSRPMIIDLSGILAGFQFSLYF